VLSSYILCSDLLEAELQLHNKQHVGCWLLSNGSHDLGPKDGVRGCVGTAVIENSAVWLADFAQCAGHYILQTRPMWLWKI
jgi:hypothetical protein